MARWAFSSFSTEEAAVHYRDGGCCCRSPPLPQSAWFWSYHNTTQKG